ncbi:FAD binding domain-containing protein [Acidicapsa ligni]|uniref:FAD binding domain-containing protein n=1 Tax=Acidicapsa ligni TaxID=542300 RepID=UPI0021E091AC|nr:FAD-dependent monooxygenase [Acidicapsa ligni]
MARILIAGGSLSGLLHAVLLRRDGHDVAVYERVAQNMSSRGGGIATQPPLWQALENAGVLEPGANKPGVALRERVVFDRSGEIIASRLHHQIVTSWDSIYRLLRPSLPDKLYHQGREATGIEEDHEGATLLFRDGAREHGDMVIAADGSRSTLRDQLLPGHKPAYAGYVAWRGLVAESALDEATRHALCERMSFFTPDKEQALIYSVPGEQGETEPGGRRLNLVWYRPARTGGELEDLLTGEDGTRYEHAIPPPAIARRTVADMREAAARLLPAPMRNMVLAIEMPFLQPVYDLRVPRLAVGRTALVGDAAVLARPHPGAGTTKAFQDAWALRQVLLAELGSGDSPNWKDDARLRNALAQYDRERAEPGRAVWEHSRFLGTHLVPGSVGGRAPGQDQHPITLLQNTALGMQ